MHALVIDDSRAMRSILRRILGSAGFGVTEAGNGREALDAIEAMVAAGTLPDVALIDWNMPVMNGYEFLEAVRARREWRSMSLMMVTTEGEQNNIVRALAAGAHEYVIKPFTAEVILDKLELLGLSSGASA